MVDLTTRLGPATLPNPVVAASGTFGHGDEMAGVCPPAGLGAVTVKSLAAYPWAGNPPLRAVPLPGGAMLNSVGLAGPGVDRWLAEGLPALERAGARVIASIWGRTYHEYAEAAAPLRDVAARLVGLEVNLSCPNLEGHDMFAQSEAETAEVVRVVRDAVGPGLPLFAKLTAAAVDPVAIAAAAMEAGATGVTLVNTLPGVAIDVERRTLRLGAGNGGLSGPPLLAVALRVVRDVRRALGPVPIIGTGGVSTGEDAVAMLLAGASAVGVGTATFAEPRATLRVVDELRAWCEAHAVSGPSELIGAVA